VSVGIVVLEALRLLEASPISTYADSSADFIHAHVEAMKRARTNVESQLADPTFDANTASDTSYTAVIDEEGNAVSLLQSIFAIFGSAAVIPHTGVLMNNRMTGFSLDPRSPNALAPGKRTVHTLNPLMVRKDGRLLMCLGTPGAAGQVYTNVLLVMRLIERGYNLQRAVEAPRWFAGPDGVLQIEDSVGDETLEALAFRGHKLLVLPRLHPSVGGAGIVRINAHGVRESGADPRRESYAVAY
jgi:gamma-glutamyltranspeptidase/glutathione hydrolase